MLPTSLSPIQRVPLGHRAISAIICRRADGRFSRCISTTPLYQQRISYASHSSEHSSRPQLPWDSEVASALARARRAADEASSAIATVHLLPSSKPPSQSFHRKLKFFGSMARLKSLLKPVVLASACVAVHALGSSATILGAMAITCLIVSKALRKGHLSASGGLMAFFVGWSLMGTSLQAGLGLLAFFLTSSALTTYGEERKRVEDDHKEGGQRDWVQVACNGAAPAVAALALRALLWASGSGSPGGLGGAKRIWSLASLLFKLPGGSEGPDSASLLTGLTATLRSVFPSLGPLFPLTSLAPALAAATLGYLAACCGDTWASELGQLSHQTPRLITTGRPVQKGTNGGVTALGLGASAAGGALVGAVYALASLLHFSGTILVGFRRAAWLAPAAAPGALASAVALLALGLACGVLGSAVDSLLGATLQFTGFNRQTRKVANRPGPAVVRIAGMDLLSNNAVNVLSALVVSFCAGVVGALYGIVLV